jgi:hypothetical protein
MALEGRAPNDLIFPFHSHFPKKKVTWIRHRDLHLLTVGKATYTPDNRFQSVHNPQADEWSLKVRSNKTFIAPHVTPGRAWSSILNH